MEQKNAKENLMGHCKTAQRKKERKERQKEGKIERKTETKIERKKRKKNKNAKYLFLRKPDVALQKK
jgi:hypothetical protein